MLFATYSPSVFAVSAATLARRFSSPSRCEVRSVGLRGACQLWYGGGSGANAEELTQGQRSSRRPLFTGTQACSSALTDNWVGCVVTGAGLAL